MKAQTKIRPGQSKGVVEEMQQGLFEQRTTLEALVQDHQFLLHILKAPIYQDGVLNLYETLEWHKSDVTEHLKNAQILLDKTNELLVLLAKINNDAAVALDDSSMRKYNNINHEINSLIDKVGINKPKILNYLTEVILR